MHSLEPVPLEAAIRRLPWRRSLRTRLLFWSSLSSVLLLLVVAAVFYAAVRGVLIDNARAELRSLAQQTARGLQATLDSVQVSGHTLAGNAVLIGSQPIALRGLLVSAVQADPDIAGAMLIIEPGRLSPTDPGFTWYVRRDGAGFAESSVEDLGYDYRVMPWYTRTVGVPRPWWSEPYRNEATGQAWFVTFNLPLRLPGDGPDRAAIGMVSLDVPLARLRTQLGQLPDHAEIRPVLVSPEGRMVLHPDPAVAMTLTVDEMLDRLGRSDIAPLVAAARRGEAMELRHRVAGTGPDAGEWRYTFAEPVGRTGWNFSLSVGEAVVLAQLSRVALWGLLGGLVGVGLCVAAVRRYSGLIARPIEDLTNSARHFAEGEFDYPLAHTGREDEVGVMARAFDTARDSIKRQMAEIAEMGASRARLDRELGIAQEIQLAMLPPGGELVDEGLRLDYEGLLVPAKYVGGDFYNVFDRDMDSLWFVIGDVSDKGVPAALFMARTMTVLEVAAQLGGSPGRALREAAKHLVEGNDNCMFATVLCGVVELQTGALSLASAGHEPPVLLHADGRRELLPVATTAPLGVDVADVYPVWRGRMFPGDTLLLYTDGITEAFDVHDQPFGEQRMLAALDPARDPKAQCEALVAAAQAHAGEAPQSDDITVLALRYRRLAGGAP